MSTLGGLFLPQFQPVDAGRAMTQGIHAAGGMLGNETALLALQDAKRQQATQADFLAYLAQHPETILDAPGGQSLLGQMAPGSAPMTQQSAMPGQPPSAPAVVPGGQDLSRFAGGGGAPPPGMPTGGQQGKNQLETLLRQNPAAALQVLDFQAKRQTQQLSVKARIAAYVGSVLQGVRDQASYEEALKEVARVAPEWAKSLPPTYSAEAVQPYIQRALDVKDQQTLQIGTIQAEADLLKARMGGRVATTDQYLKAIGVRPGEETEEDMRKAIALQTQDQMRIQGANVTPQIVEGEGNVKYAVNPRTLETRPIPGPGQAPGQAGSSGEPMRGPMSADDKKIADYASRMREGQKQVSALEDSGDYTSWKAPLANVTGGRLMLSDKQRQYENAKGLFLQGILRRDSQGQITETERRDYGRDFFPLPGEGPEEVKQKRAMREGAIRAQEGNLQRAPQTPYSPGGEVPAVPQGTPQPPARPKLDLAAFRTWQQQQGVNGPPTAAMIEQYFQSQGGRR